MAWIESHQQLKDHPKVVDLMCAMGWNLNETIGALHRFWWWCVDYAEDGDLRRHSELRIASSVGLEGEKAVQFVQAMKRCGWIDSRPYFRVHDWWDYIGLFLQRRYGNKQPSKWQKIKELYDNSCTTVVQKAVHQLAQPNQPNLTKPNTYAQSFERFWKEYPRKNNKGTAEKAWLRLKPDTALQERIFASLGLAKKSQGWLKDGGQFIPYPASWLNAKGWEDDYESSYGKESARDRIRRITENAKQVS